MQPWILTPLFAYLWTSVLLFDFSGNIVLAQRRNSRTICPDGCLCFVTTVRCMHLGLDHVPSVPSETRILLLNNNFIRSISEDDFEGLTSLKYLYLYKNRIQTIHKRAFRGLQSLEQLYLHDNEIRSLSPSTFSNLPNLQRLFLHDNKLTSLPSQLFSRLTSLKRLRLDENHLRCDCHLAWLSRMLRTPSNEVQANAQCSSPRRLGGRRVDTVPPEDMVCDAGDIAGPVIIYQPRDAAALQGRSFRLNCRARGSPEPEISWQHNGRVLSDDGRRRIMADGSLLVQSARQSDRGTYRCTAENSEGEAVSNPATVEYIGSNGAPTFLATPRNQQVNENDQVTLDCRAAGNPSPVIRWYLNNQRLPIRSNFVIAEDALRIRSVSQRENGTYTCQALNVEGTVNATATLFVRRPPTFTITPEDQTVVQGRSVTLDCQAGGIPTPSIMWLKNGEALNRDQRYLMMSSGSLLIRATNPEDEGTYTCKARSESGILKAAVTLSVIMPPHFLIRPQNQHVPQGTTVHFQCRIGGRPQPHIVWTVNGRAVPDDTRYSLLASGTLRVLRVEPSDAGVYRCVGANALGEVHSEVTLTIINRTPLIFIRSPTDQEVESGTDVQISCQIRGGGNSGRDTEIFWSKDGVRIVSTTERYSVTSAPSSVLNILAVGRDDSGRYECTARSGGEVITASMTLVVRVKSSVSEIVEQLSTILPVSCLRNGCTRELTAEEDHEATMFSQRSFEEVLEYFGPRTRRQSVSPSLVSVTDLRATIHNAADEVDRGINGSIRYFNQRRNRQSAGDLLALMRFPSTREGIDVIRAAEVFDVSLRMIECCVRRGLKLKKLKFRHLSVSEDLDGRLNPGRQGSSQRDEVLSLIGSEVVELVANLSGCSSQRTPPDCSTNICFHRKYRTSDGTCNNLQRPMWGSSLTPFHRLLQPIYENGFNSPIGWNHEKLYNNHRLPSARSVSVSLLMSAPARPPRDDPLFTHMVMQWGQFLDHDLDFTTMAPSIQRFSDGVACRDTCEKGTPCFPILVDDGDPRHGRFHHHSRARSRETSQSPGSQACMEFTRSSAVCGSGITSVFFSAISRREQINEITSYLDASNVYSSSELGTRNLRDLSTDFGLLKEGQSLEVGQKPLLPYNVYSDLNSNSPLIRPVAPIECRRGGGESAQQRGVPCFLAGDLRANEQVSLTAMHTLWMREHNRIARYLRQANPHWDGDTIFHETRKIVGAQMQHITYSSWLPKLLGSFVDRIGRYEGYDPNTPSSIVNVFATAAYRFGHTMINPVMYRLNGSWHEVDQGHLMLHQAFFAPFRIVHEGGIDPLVRGLIAKPMKARDPGSSMNSELIERLFSMAEEVALDLGALNIQRGRDHALPFYNDWRQFCNLSRAETFDDLAPEINNVQVRAKLRELYRVPANIDPFVGMIVEDVVPGSRLGPTLGCILTEQFKRTRDGDRFWYENPGIFSPSQITAIKQTSLARIICDNTDSIKTIPRDVFLNQPTSDFVSCDELPSVDLSAWVDCCSDCSSSGSFETLSGHVTRQARSKRSTGSAHLHQHLQHIHHTKIVNSSSIEFPSVDVTVTKRDKPKHNGKTDKRRKTLTKQAELTNEDLRGSVTELLALVKSLEKKVVTLQDEVQRLERKLPGQE